MTPELLQAMGRGYRLRATVQRRIEYALMICLFAGLIAVIQHFSGQNLRPLTFGTLAVALVIAASAWPVAVQQQQADRRARWLKSQEDRSTRILPDAPDPFESQPGLSSRRGRAVL
jgi:hypothetical protein